jgi:hypothetical protein
MGLVRKQALTGLITSNAKRLGPLEKTLRAQAKSSPTLGSPILTPKAYRGHDYQIAGRAFDFWLRGFLAVRYGGVAEAQTVNELVVNDPTWQGYLNEATVTYDDGRIVTMRTELVDAVQARRQAIRKGAIDTEAFFENCVTNAMAEGLYRSGEMTNLGSHPDNVIADLRALANAATDRQAFFDGAGLDLNPMFPHQTIAADGDFAIGPRLVELKTVKDQLPPLVFCQVVSYALLEAWERGCDVRSLRYREVAVYSARHALFAIVDLHGGDGLLSDLRAFLQEASDKQRAFQLTPAGRVTVP